uniref:Uncharacterized protein n=1 Tax=Arundo donax TaxID=35708 RepID=A0A0A9C063_ARUDO
MLPFYKIKATRFPALLDLLFNEAP